MVYEKTLRISSVAANEAEAITLMSADIDRIAMGIKEIHLIYGSGIQLSVTFWLLSRLLGVAIAASAAWYAVGLVIGFFTAIAAGRAHHPWLEAISLRLAATSKILASMKSIKISGLARKVEEDIRASREHEIRASLRHRCWNVFVFTFSYASTALAPPIGFGVFMLLAQARGSQTLTTSTAYAALTLYMLLDQPLITLVEGHERVQGALIAFTRIQEYLQSDERQDLRSVRPEERRIQRKLKNDSECEKLGSNGSLSVNEKSPDHSTLSARCLGVSASYSAHRTPILSNLDLEIHPRTITIVVGPVGCGKSTLLKTLLGEMPIVSGTVETAFTRVAYCSQSPWICYGTLQQNIMGTSQWDATWYSRVVNACCLDVDFARLPHGDMTPTGSTGSRLSGGQRNRVSLARALYSRLPVVVLDDCLCGLDNTTLSTVAAAVLGPQGLLRESQTTVIIASSSASYLTHADSIVTLNEQGEVEERGTYFTLSNSGGFVSRMIGEGDAPANSESNDGNDAHESKSVQPEDALHRLGLQEVHEPDMDSSRSASDAEVYLYYIRTAGWFKISLFILWMGGLAFGLIFPSYWLVYWTDYNQDHPNQRIGYYLGVYFMLGALQIISIGFASWVYMLWIVPETGRKLHDALLRTTMSANMSHLSSTDIGITTNRFGQDLQIVDNDLQAALSFTVSHLLLAFGTTVSVAIGSGYLAATLPVLFVVLYLLEWFYLRTSRQLRLLDLEAKAPLFSGFLEALSGLSTIRAYGWIGDYKQRCINDLNRSQSPYWLLWSIQRWLTLVLGLVAAAMAVLLVGIVTHVQTSTTPYLATALFNVVGLSGVFRELVQQWTELETALGAVSRIRKYVLDTPQEGSTGNVGNGHELSEHWPEHGSITFAGVFAHYHSSTEQVVKNINLHIQGGEKIAFCGRTGSGKSSLIGTLLRTLELSAGSMIVDAEDITRIPRDDLRERFNVLPQDPILLHGSIRHNLDPRGRFAQNDAAIIDALRAVKLDKILLSRAGCSLDDSLNEDLLSHGQRQLFCLARCVLASYHSSIVILDEATSSVDSETDARMQAVIRERLWDKTVIVVAHKLRAVLDFDRIAVIDHGCIIECDHPETLMKRQGSALALLYESGGLG